MSESSLSFNQQVVSDQVRENKAIKILSTVLLIGLGFLLIAGEGLFKFTTVNETYKFTVALSEVKLTEAPKEILYDFNKQGILKALFQPGSITISAGHGGGIINSGNISHNVKIRIEGLKGANLVKSEGFNEVTGMFKEALAPGDTASVSIRVDLPRDELSKNYLVDEGKLVFTDYKTNQILASVPVKLVNSSVK